MQSWRLIDNTPKRAPLNMAIDEAIAEAVGKGLAPPTLRFYAWRTPAVSIGCFQKIDEIDQKKCLLHNYDIVRRPTGGRAIIHDKELTYSVVSPADNPLLSKNILDTYKALHNCLMVGLKKLGINAEMVSGRDKKAIKSSACFFSPSIYELTVKGKKVVGSAQKRWQKAMLQQGSILLELDIEELCKVFANRNIKSMREKAFQKMTSIYQELGKAVEIDKVKEAVIDGFEEALRIKLHPDRLTDYETAMAFRLSREKYSTHDWNYKR